MSDLGPLFDERFLRRLDALSLVVRKRRAGQFRGDRRSPKRGSSVEFADYRDYVQGDDLRRVDWNIYARLERPYLKLYEEEEELSVHLLLDASLSMDWGEPAAGEGDTPDTDTDAATNKWTYCRRTAAALGYIALGSGDRLTVSLLQERLDGSEPQRFGPVRGAGQTLRLLRYLAEREASGPTDLNRALRAYAFGGHRAGLAVLISDLLTARGYQDGLTALLARGYEGTLIHVLAPSEIDPPLTGALRLVDVESGREQEVTIDAEMRGLYRRRVAAWREETHRWCGQRGVAYVPVDTDTPFDELILYHLRRQGLVR
jgi:uncharacterized protein (DUF58 family)